MATLTTKFGLGATVWKISPEREELRLPCLDCRGSGWVTASLAGDRTEQVRCPRHTGSGNQLATIPLGTWPEWRVNPSPLTIGQIQVRVFDRKSQAGASGRGENNDPVSRMSRDQEDEESYMCWSTGVGSGTVHRAEDLFADRAEAEAAAEARTERARAGVEPTGSGHWRQWWPSQEQVRIAAAFLFHRDIYEHNQAHVALAQAIVEAGAKRERGR